MRLSAEWMSLADDRILEFLREEGPHSPSRMAEDNRLSFSRSHINRRCKRLTEEGLTENLGNGVYAITEDGTHYLDGELDLRTETN